MLSRDQPPKLSFADHALELELRRPAANPDPRRLAATGVVVVDTARDRALVVRLLARRQLRHGEYRDILASRMAYVSRVLLTLLRRPDGASGGLLGVDLATPL